EMPSGLSLGLNSIQGIRPMAWKQDINHPDPTNFTSSLGLPKSGAASGRVYYTNEEFGQSCYRSLAFRPHSVLPSTDYGPGFLCDPDTGKPIGGEVPA